MEPGNHVGAGRTGCADAHADVTGLGARVAIGHMRRTLHVARQDMADGTSLAQCRIERVDRGTGYAEGDRNALTFQHEHSRFYRPYPGHQILPRRTVIQRCVMEPLLQARTDSRPKRISDGKFWHTIYQYSSRIPATAAF